MDCRTANNTSQRFFGVMMLAPAGSHNTAMHPNQYTKNTRAQQTDGFPFPLPLHRTGLVAVRVAARKTPHRASGRPFFCAFVMINFLLLVSRQGKTRLSKWYEHYPTKEKARAIRELTTLVLARAPKMCNFIEWRDKKVGWAVL